MESLRGLPDGDPGAGRIDWTTFVDFTNLAAAGERRGWRTVCRAQSRKNRKLDVSWCFFNVSSMFLQCSWCWWCIFRTFQNRSFWDHFGFRIVLAVWTPDLRTFPLRDPVVRLISQQRGPRFYGPQNLLEQVSRLNLTLNAPLLKNNLAIPCVGWRKRGTVTCLVPAGTTASWIFWRVSLLQGNSYSVPGYAVLQQDGWVSRHVKGWYGRESVSQLKRGKSVVLFAFGQYVTDVESA